MKSFLGMLPLFFALPLIAGPSDCSDGQTIEALVERSAVVALGSIDRVARLGCRTPEGSLEACDDRPTDGIAAEQAFFVTLKVNTILKGDSAEVLEFVVFSSVLQLGCTGPGFKRDTETLVFVRQANDRAEAWGGDFALYQEDKSDFAVVVSQATDLIAKSRE